MSIPLQAAFSTSGSKERAAVAAVFVFRNSRTLKEMTRRVESNDDINNHTDPM